MCRQSFEPTEEFVFFAAKKILQTQWSKVRWGRSTRLLLPVLRESILRLLWWEHTQVKAVMDGPVQKRDVVSRNIQRSVAVQTQQSKLTHPVNKALHHTCVNCSGLGLKAIAVCPAFICRRKFHIHQEMRWPLSLSWGLRHFSRRVHIFDDYAVVFHTC